MRVHLILPQVLGAGGIQRYNRRLVDMVCAILSPVYPRVYSLNDESTSAMRGFTRHHASFVRAVLCDALVDRPEVVLLGHANLAPLTLSYRTVVPAAHTYVLCHGKEVEIRRSPLSRCGLQGASGVVAVSEWTRRLVVDVQGVPFHRTHVLRYGLPAFNPPVVPDVRPVASSLRVLSVARLHRGDRYKGIDVTLEAISILRASIPEISYTVVGDGDDRGWLAVRAAELGIGDRVSFLGEVTEDRLADEYALCDVFVLPSTHEGLGLVYLEAMARAKPVIGVNAGGVSDAIVHGANGLLIDRQDPVALATSIARLAADPPLRERMGSSGRDAILSRFSSAQMEATLRALLCRVSTSRRAHLSDAAP